MENKSHAMAAGLFVVALAALLIGLALWLTRDRHEYNVYELSTTDAISGLQNQATVRYKGVAVGKVTSVGFDPTQTGNVLIRIAVDAGAPVSPERTYAQLGYQGVTGIAHIQLDDNTEALQPPPLGPSGYPRLVMKTSPLTVLADQGMLIVSKVDEATRRINQLLGDDNQARFSQVLDNLATASSHIGTMTESLDRTLHTRVNPALEEFPGAARDARKAMQSLEQAGQEARQLLASLQAQGGTLEQARTGAQSLARAAERLDRATLPALAQAAVDVSDAASEVERLVEGLGDNPQSLLYGNGPARPGPGEPGFVPPVATVPAR